MVGAVEIGEGEEEAKVAEVKIPTIRIIETKIKMHRRIQTRHPTLPPKTTKRVPSTRTYLLMQDGRARSTGRKGGGHLIVVTPLSASGSTWWPQDNEVSANLDYRYLKIQ